MPPLIAQSPIPQSLLHHMNIWTIAVLTIREARRRRILWIALVMGLLFLLVFATGVHLIFRDFERTGMALGEEFVTGPASILMMAGLYVTNFLVIIMSVLISVAAISNEIETRLIDVFVTKPVARWQIVVGKWLGFALMAAAYSYLLAGGVILVTTVRTGYQVFNPVGGLALIALNAVMMLTISIAGGTRLSTLANGVLAFMLFGIAFVGGWIETIGGLLRNETAVNLGILSSLLVPNEAIWRKATVILNPRMLGNYEFAGPLAVTSEPSDAMIVYAVLYVIVLLWFAIYSFGQRDL